MDLVVGTCLGDGNLGSLRVVFWRYCLRVTLLGCWIGLKGGLRVSGRGEAGWDSSTLGKMKGDGNGERRLEEE
jgi:hypothetical protein